MPSSRSSGRHLDALLYLYRHDRVLRKVIVVAKAIEGLLVHRRGPRSSTGKRGQCAHPGGAGLDSNPCFWGDEGMLWYLADRWQAEHMMCGSQEAEDQLRSVSALALDILEGRLFADPIVCEKMASASPSDCDSVAARSVGGSRLSWRLTTASTPTT